MVQSSWPGGKTWAGQRVISQKSKMTAQAAKMEMKLRITVMTKVGMAQARTVVALTLDKETLVTQELAQEMIRNRATRTRMVKMMVRLSL